MAELFRYIQHTYALPAATNAIDVAPASTAKPFKCHVCGGVLTWRTLTVDHLDDDPANNDPPN